MKYIIWAGGSLLVLFVAVFVLQIVASERVEVVEVHTTTSSADTVTTRLWVVDDEGFPYLRTGASGSRWFTRLQASEEFHLTRNGETARYFFVLRPDKSERINELMQQKYTWGDSFIAALVGGREGSIPVELHRLD